MRDSQFLDTFELLGISISIALVFPLNYFISNWDLPFIFFVLRMCNAWL